MCTLFILAFPKTDIITCMCNFSISDFLSSESNKFTEDIITEELANVPPPPLLKLFRRIDHAGTFINLKCVVYYANYCSWHQFSKIQVVP